MNLMTIFIFMMIFFLVSCREVIKESQFDEEDNTFDTNPILKKNLINRYKDNSRTDILKNHQITDPYSKQKKTIFHHSGTKHKDFKRTHRKVPDNRKLLHLSIILVFLCSILSVVIFAIFLYFIFFRKRNSSDKKNPDLEEQSSHLLKFNEDEDFQLSDDETICDHESDNANSQLENGSVKNLTKYVKVVDVVKDSDEMMTNDLQVNQEHDSNQNRMAIYPNSLTEYIVTELEKKLNEVGSSLKQLKNNIKDTTTINLVNNKYDHPSRNSTSISIQDRNNDDAPALDTRIPFSFETHSFLTDDDSSKQEFEEQILKYDKEEYAESRNLEPPNRNPSSHGSRTYTNDKHYLDFLGSDSGRIRNAKQNGKSRKIFKKSTCQRYGNNKDSTYCKRSSDSTKSLISCKNCRNHHRTKWLTTMKMNR
ncbi:uncharacterized protein LOC111613945 isoform X2 [Centruroides sculpturatus]|uniref:uncharacterized protein LOC111613945 isoform X2 n=1 Tax=Centruroides sculpturatus TaxID=218467 RepID=UPI000C6E7395|nr:uncharacterized protein LOC111613945 isoform X2 [Centruroides sculpturatus]